MKFEAELPMNEATVSGFRLPEAVPAVNPAGLDSGHRRILFSLFLNMGFDTYCWLVCSQAGPLTKGSSGDRVCLSKGGSESVFFQSRGTLNYDSCSARPPSLGTFRQYSSSIDARVTGLRMAL